MHFKKINKDDILLDEFMEECKSRGYTNNISIKDLKFDYFEHSAFFAGIEDNKIKVFSGVHNFDFNGVRYWRVGFRGVTLNDNKHTPKISRNLRKASLNMGVNFTLSMKWVENYFGSSEFIMTSNTTDSPDGAGRSHAVDKLVKKGYLEGASLLYENIEYLNTKQNVWLLNSELWHSDFDKYYRGSHTIDLSFCN